MTDPVVRTFVITLTLGLWLVIAQAAWRDGLADSWQRGGPGTRHALDVAMSREWMAMTGSAVIPARMQ